MFFTPSTIAKSRAATFALIGVFVVGGILIACPSARADDKVDMQPILTEMRKQRELLRSGVYRVTGTVSRETSPVEQPKGNPEPAQVERSGEIEIFGAFDFDRKLIRFDRRSPLELDALVIYCRSTEASYHFSPGRIGGGGSVRIFPADADQPPEVSGAGWMDIRALGWSGVKSLFGLGHYDNVLERHPRANIPKSIATDGPITHLIYENRVSNELCDYRIDTANGYTITRATRQDVGQVKGDPKWGKNNIVRDIEWKKMGEVWVPVRYVEMYRSVTIDRSGKHEALYRTEEQAWNIEWESVNKPVDESLFDYKKLPVPKNTNAFDYRVPAVKHPDGSETRSSVYIYGRKPDEKREKR